MNEISAVCLHAHTHTYSTPLPSFFEVHKNAVEMYEPSLSLTSALSLFLCHSLSYSNEKLMTVLSTSEVGLTKVH